MIMPSSDIIYNTINNICLIQNVNLRIILYKINKNCNLIKKKLKTKNEIRHFASTGINLPIIFV